MIGAALQVVYQLAATFTEWFLQIGTQFFNGLGGWLGRQFT